MGPLTDQLIESLDKLIEILEEDGDKHWSHWLRESKRLIQAEDFRGVEKFLGAFGGMGSFNDFQLSTIGRSNESFSKLQSSSYTLAEEIKRSYESSI